MRRKITSQVLSRGLTGRQLREMGEENSQADLSTQSRKKPPPPRERKTQSCHYSEHSLETKVILVLDLVSANAGENRELPANTNVY